MFSVKNTPRPNARQKKFKWIREIKHLASGLMCVIQVHDSSSSNKKISSTKTVLLSTTFSHRIDYPEKSRKMFVRSKAQRV